MCAGDGAQNSDEHDKDGASWNGVAKQRNRDVTTGELRRHDPGTDDGRDKQSGAKRLGGKTAMVKVIHHLTYALSAWVDDQLAIFLAKCTALLNRKQIEHSFGWTTELDAERRDHDRPIDQDRMRHHRIK